MFAERAQDEIWADEDTITSSCLRPTGATEPAPGGYRVKGRWPYVSGVDHTDWTVTGVMLQAILAAHPNVQGTLFDLPQVVAPVKNADRFDVVGGDIFKDPLPRGDAYVLSQILHGWPDGEAAKILSRCVEAGGAGVRIVVVEGVLPDRPTAGEAGFDLFMLTLSGGRQRTLADFRRLGEAVGLASFSAQPLETRGALVELRR